MASNFKISNVAAIAACDALVDLLDAGTAYIRIYDGSQPAGVDVAVSDQTLLAQLTFSNPAFGDAVDADPGATATANPITTDSSAEANGTASWFRVVRVVLGVTSSLFDGSVGTSDADLVINDTGIVEGRPVAATSLTLTMPES